MDKAPVFKCVTDSIMVVVDAGTGMWQGESYDDPVAIKVGQYVAWDGVGELLGVYDTLQLAERAQRIWCGPEVTHQVVEKLVAGLLEIERYGFAHSGNGYTCATKAKQILQSVGL